jgi:hypothetical protein
MQCWSLLIGARSLRTNARRFSRADDRLLQEITTRHFPAGFTILHATGGWFDSTRHRFIHEESRQVLIAGATRARVRRWGLELGRALAQEELVVIRLGTAFRLQVGKRSRRS